MTRPVGTPNKRTKRFTRMLARLEREKKISVEAVLIRLYETATSPDYEKNPDRNAAAKAFLDRALGPTVHAFRVEHALTGVDAVTALLREIGAAEEQKRLTAGAITVEVEKEDSDEDPGGPRLGSRGADL
jgi:hypothetical protein